MEQQAQRTASNSVLSALSDSRRREALKLLRDRTSAVALQELATHLVAAEQGKPLVDVNTFEMERVHRDLVHNQLPRLVEADLVKWDQQAGTVAVTNHPALRDPKLQQILDTEADNLDDVLASLAHRRRRIVLSALKDHQGSMERTDLAKEVLAREREDSQGQAQDDHVQDGHTKDSNAHDVVAALHHVHLPKLAQAGLVTYSVESGTASYDGHPALEDEWLDARLSETPRAILPEVHHSEAIWTIEGRDNVIARGQSLFEQADDELFLMFTTDGLLEDGCIRRLKDAVDRGVDVYLGSQTPEVRDLVREHVPEAVVWEPQMDWLNLPPEYEKVGRLVFADREAIMLATLGKETDSGTHAETAVTGDGENNPLAVLMRDMLGSRLDHLDAQSEDFLAEIPL